MNTVHYVCFCNSSNVFIYVCICVWMYTVCNILKGIGHMATKETAKWAMTDDVNVGFLFCFVLFRS